MIIIFHLQQTQVMEKFVETFYFWLFDEFLFYTNSATEYLSF